MSSANGEPVSAGEITEVQGAANDSERRATAQKTLSEEEQALHNLVDTQFQITETGATLGSGRQGKIVKTQYKDKSLVLKLYKDIRSTPPEKLWDENIFNIIEPHVCSAVGYTKVHDGKGSIAWIMPQHLLDLRKLIDSQPPFPYATAVDLIVQLAIGMRALHRRKIMHRDIRAENLLVTAIGTKFHSIAIADFDGGKGVIGTGFWRAHEILAAIKRETRIDEVKYTFPCDVYSFAVTCYEILTGERPFRGTPWSEYDIILSGERPTLPEYLPHEITSLIHRCWHEEPSRRPEATEILNHLRKLILHNPDLKPLQMRLDLADIWSGDGNDAPPRAELLQSFQHDLHLLENENETEAARLGNELIALYQDYESKFGLVSVWKLPRFWEKVPAVLGMVNKGNEFVKSLPDHGPNTVQTLKTWSRLVRPIVFVDGFGSILRTFVRRYSGAMVAFIRANGLVPVDYFRDALERMKVVSGTFWASEYACRVRYVWASIVRGVKKWLGVHEPCEIQALVDSGLLTGDFKTS